MTRSEWYALFLGVVLLLTLILLPAPAHAVTTPVCYRTKTGTVYCVGQTQAGGSGITPVKRWKN